MRSPTRILIVEDSATQAEALRLTLEAEGFEATTAPDAEAALASLERAPVDAIISDILMPGLSGYDLCRRIKSDPRWKAVPVVLLTSLTDPIDVIHALESGADSFLSKPYETDHLIARVNNLLENRRLRAGTSGGPGLDVLFQGRRFTIPSDREQILDLLVSTFEDMVRKNDELTAARDALAAKNEQLLRLERQKEELSALVVHDLKSPAAGILMAAQARLRNPQLSDDDRRLWGMVCTSAEVINRMVLNLLDIASSSDGVFAVRPSVVDLQKLVHDVARLMTPAAESLGQTIEAELPEHLPPLEADPELLRRVLQNLVENALRHSPTGSAVRLDVVARNQGIRFRVHDRGPGVSAALRERIFDKYVQVTGDREDLGVLGKGLGLTFSRMAVEAHGGRIWVEDHPPRGSTFVVELPSRRERT